VSSDLAGGSVFAGYRIHDPIARGGMGIIYRANEVSGDRLVALKVIAPEFAGDRLFRERFKREARLAAALDHPNVIPIYGAGEADGRLFLAMRLVEGIDLQAIIAAERRLHPRHAVQIVSQMASALDAAHESGLVHRDVKPGNVLLEPGKSGEPIAYLTDFGLSKMTASQTGLTRTGRWVGTVDYAAPEQVQAAETDARTDVYGLGCVLYEALTGEVPFPRERDVLKIIAHISEEPPSLEAVVPDCPAAAELGRAIRNALAKDPGERFQSAGALARVVEATVAAVPAPARALELWPQGGGDGASDVDRSAPTVG
jgi:serine/threonine protein kinase